MKAAVRIVAGLLRAAGKAFAAALCALGAVGVAFSLASWYTSYKGKSGLDVRLDRNVLQFAEADGRLWAVSCSELGYEEAAIWSRFERRALGVPEMLSRLETRLTDGELVTGIRYDLILSHERSERPRSWQNGFGFVSGCEWSFSVRNAIMTRYCAVPHWFLLFVSLLTFVWCGQPMRRSLRQSLWRRRGRCRTCGYDLRATLDRCPECGTPVPAGHAPQVTPAPPAQKE